MPPSLDLLNTLGVVLELLVVEKQLLSGGEHELAVAVGANQNSVDELDFHIASPPFGKG